MADSDGVGVAGFWWTVGHGAEFGAGALYLYVVLAWGGLLRTSANAERECVVPKSSGGMFGRVSGVAVALFVLGHGCWAGLVPGLWTAYGATVGTAWAGTITCGNEDPGCTIYVRSGASQPTGPCAGRSRDTAFSTIQEGAAVLVNGGDNLCVLAGEYVEGNLSPGSGGTAGFPVVMRAIGDVRIRPPGTVSTDCATIPTTGFLLLGVRNVRIEGFDIEGFCDAGIQVRSDPLETRNSRGIVLRDNTIRRTRRGRGIDIAGEGPVEIVGNRVSSNQGSGISVQGCVRAPDVEPKCMPGTEVPIEATISDNEVFRNESHGIFVRGTNGTRIANNRCYTNRDGSGVQLNASSETLVFNNLIYANGRDGIRVGAPDRGTESDPLEPRGSADTVIVSNTIVGNGEWGIEIGEPDAGSPGSVVLNNIVQDNGTSAIDDFPGEIGVLHETNAGLPSTCGYVAGFNLVDGPNTEVLYGPSTPFNLYDIQAEAGFVERPEVNDFRLRPDSPAIDAGYADTDVVGISGSVLASGQRDQGVADLGFHSGADSDGMPRFDSTIMPIYVRVSGSDRNNQPTSPETALATIDLAANLARAGVEVVVGPGTYREGQIATRNNPPPGGYIFRADPSGRRSGDAPGAVRVIATGHETGFLIQGACGARVEGFDVSGANEAGIQIQSGSANAEVVHNIVHDNLQRGIQTVNARNVRIFNNLVYDNGVDGAGGGIQLGGNCPDEDPDCTTGGSPNAEITFNTVYNNEVNGIFVGAGPGDSSGATVRYNISVENRLGNAIQIGSNDNRDIHLRNFMNGYNVLDSFSDAAEVDEDLDYFWAGVGEPLFVNAAAGRFELDPFGTAAIDRAEDLLAKEAGLDARSTQVDRTPDGRAADLGYHYPILDIELAGDCDGNGVVSIGELIVGVNIALARTSLNRCEAFDCNDDGRVAIGELIKAIGAALGGR